MAHLHNPDSNTPRYRALPQGFRVEGAIFLFLQYWWLLGLELIPTAQSLVVIPTNEE